MTFDFSETNFTFSTPKFEFLHPKFDALSQLKDVAEAKSILESTPLSEYFISEIRDESQALCCLSGFWLRFGFLDESHTISQDLKFREGSYWHGLMHREEQDYWNSKYWFDRVGSHPIHEEIAKSAQQNDWDGPPSWVANGMWQPAAFVDFCEQVEHSADSSKKEQRDAWKELEWFLLMDFCGRSAIGHQQV